MAVYELFLGIVSLIFGAMLLASFVLSALYIRYIKHQKILTEAKHEKAKPHEGPDVIIVGAGYAGSAMATVLARDGRSVALIERSAEPPYRVVGEHFLPGAVKTMKDLGIEVSAEDCDGAIIDNYEIYMSRKESFLLPLPMNALQAANANVVKAIHKLALAEERCSFIEGNVVRLCLNNGTVTGVEYKDKMDEELKVMTAPLTIVADGAYSRFRSINIPRKLVQCNVNTALEVEATSEYGNSLVLVATSLGVWGAGVPLPPNQFRFVLNTNNKYERADLLRIVEEFPEYLQECYRAAAGTSALHTVPVFYLPPSSKHVPGVITIGDAHSIRNSIGAAGLTVAIMDVALWRNLLLGIPYLYNYKAMFAAENVFALRRTKYSISIDLLGYCLRHFLMPTSEGLKLIGATFGEYIQTIKRDYASMVSGVDTRPHLLLYHLAMVTFFTMFKAISSGGLTGLPSGIYQAVLALCSAGATIVPHVMCHVQSMIVTKK